MSASAATAKLVSQLIKFSTCEISDALIKLGLPHGGHLPGIDMYSPSTSHASSSSSPAKSRICGPAFTVRMVSQKDAAAPKPAQHFVDAVETAENAGKGCVMLVTAPSSTRSAIWGGLMSARAKALGVEGVILDGRCRDLSEHRQAGFPVFARGHSTLGQSPFTRPSELQVPLTITDPTLPPSSDDSPSNPPFPSITVNPGDLLLADEDGVVCVPPDLAEQAVDLAAKGVEIDARCMEDLQKGRSIKETFAEHRGKK